MHADIIQANNLTQTRGVEGGEGKGVQFFFSADLATLYTLTYR